MLLHSLLFLLLCALQWLPAPYVVGVMRLSLVLSILGGRLFFREPDGARRLTAGLLIVGGVFLIACFTW